MTLRHDFISLSLALPLCCTIVPTFAQTAITPTLANTNPQGRVVLIDRIVAVVNDDAITQRDLNERMRIIEAQLARNGVRPPGREEFEKQVLDRAITDRTQIHFAKEAGIRIDDLTLDRAVARIAQDSGTTPDKFRDALERDGINYFKFREDIRGEIMISRIREREVDSKVPIAEGEVGECLRERAGGATSTPVSASAGQDLNLSQILIRVPENASPEQIEARKKRAEEALAALKGGRDFVQVSVTYSDANNAATGGNFGWRPVDRLPELFVNAVERIKPGEVSPIVKSANGFHIVLLVDRRSAGSASNAGAAGIQVTQTRARHILIKTNEITSSQEAERRLIGIKERLDNKAADFEALARQFSQDASGPKGGDLGWVYPGDTVPDFERAMDALQPGQVSKPVQSPFGWHLIEVVERKREDASAERQRQSCMNAIRDRKSEENYQEWVRQIRDRAYVEVRLEER